MGLLSTLVAGVAEALQRPPLDAHTAKDAELHSTGFDAVSIPPLAVTRGRLAANHFEAHQRHASFLGVTAGGNTTSGSGFLPSAGNSADGVCSFPSRPGWRKAHRRGSSFKGVFFHGPWLSPDVQLKLMYVSPDIYSTDIAEWDTETFGYKFAGTKENDKTLFAPNIRFKKFVKKIHVKMVDTYNGRVFWDANYNLMFIPGVGSYELSSTSKPDTDDPGPMSTMRKFWISELDPGPHLFDIAISTKDNWYDDQQDTPWGDAEGFDNLRGHDAHIGVEVRRLPVLEGKGEEKIQHMASRSSIADARAYGMDQMLRVQHGEENVFEDPETKDPGFDYYGWMIKKDARTRDNYAYMFKPLNQIPLLRTPRTYVTQAQKEMAASQPPPASPAGGESSSKEFNSTLCDDRDLCGCGYYPCEDPKRSKSNSLDEDEA